MATHKGRAGAIGIGFSLATLCDNVPIMRGLFIKNFSSWHLRLRSTLPGTIILACACAILFNHRRLSRSRASPGRGCRGRAPAERALRPPSAGGRTVGHRTLPGVFHRPFTGTVRCGAEEERAVRLAERQPDRKDQ